MLTAQAKSGRCVLFSSHQLDLVEGLCESVTIIDHGRVVVSGKVDDLTTRGRRRLVDRGAGRLLLDASADTDTVLKTAMAAGRVTSGWWRPVSYASACAAGFSGSPR